MPDAQVLIGQIVLTSTQTSVAFANIPQTFGDLRLVATTVSSANAESYAYTYFNSDTGSNYSRVELYGSGSTPGSAATANLIPMTMTASGSGIYGSLIMNIMDYAATNKNKPVIYRNDASNSNALIGGGRWASNTAITSLTITAYSNAFGAGSVFSLYGVLA